MPSFLNPVNGLDDQTQEYQIEGITYFITVRWNYRDGWEVSIADSANVRILSGLIAVPSQNITWRYSRSTGLFTGDLWIDNTELGSKDTDITRENFGQGLKYRLTYRTKNEMDQAGINPRGTDA